MQSTKHCLSLSIVCLVSLLGTAVLAVPAHAKPFAYVTNAGSSSVSVIDTATNTVIATIAVGDRPVVVAIAPNGSRAYVANSSSNSVSVIDTASNTVIATIGLQSFPQGLAITPNGSHVYVANTFSNSVSVIDTASNTVIASIGVGMDPDGVGITPDGSRVYVANANSGSVSVIDTTTNTVTDTVGVGVGDLWLAITPDGSRAYVTNSGSSSVSVAKRKDAWYRKHGGNIQGQVGDVLGNCFSLAAPGPVHRNTTVRDALNLMAKRSLKVSRGEVTPNDPIYPPYKPLSWKFRFRREPDADTGLGGVPLFQTF